MKHGTQKQTELRMLFGDNKLDGASDSDGLGESDSRESFQRLGVIVDRIVSAVIEKGPTREGGASLGAGNYTMGEGGVRTRGANADAVSAAERTNTTPTVVLKRRSSPD